MKEFILIFRKDDTEQHLPENDIQLYLKHWQDWFLSMAARDMLVRAVQRCDSQGVVVKKGSLTMKGPYRVCDETIGGLIIIKASNYDNAMEIAQGCPVLELGGSIEIRMAV
jgi:putative heme degradation protein